MHESMTKGRARLRTAWRRIASVQVRMLLSLGLVLGFAAVGTTAYWADTATFTTGKIEAGSLDLQLGGRHPVTDEIQWQAIGLDQPWNYSVLQLDNVSPGESVAMELHLRNVGTTPLTFTGVGTSASNDLGTHLKASTWLGAAARNDGTREAVNRKGHCDNGTEAWWAGHALSTTPAHVTPNNRAVSLVPGASIQVCILAGLAAEAPNSIQGKSTTIKVVLTGKQVGTT
ncbi:hypothetical protein H9L21_06715 [Aeromicrobium senzhongii]|uniref:Uncharacterized protein n=1 Tax=Aeromicrobium senzhongii TaxID=2663859 RepID=A0A8I0EUE5_9ACTN|nr:MULTISPECIES: SipW-dependent-type signal peptide-containing protein [Aeromicrobium]MBC9225302.1 hypothetical protein [Aeromicrobium senzhongii]QNL95593.1 hypothetical protein H9L21_06715 [Aeromicrobium senzhongii]